MQEWGPIWQLLRPRLGVWVTFGVTDGQRLEMAGHNALSVEMSCGLVDKKVSQHTREPS